MKHDSKTKRFTGWQVPFFAIWTGQAFSLLGSRIVQFALVWWLTERTGSATVLATATLVALLPEILLSPIAGAYVDRWNRRIVMIVADSLIALASIWLAYLFWSGSMQIWHVYVIMLVRALGGCFHWPAMQASTSLMAPREHLARIAGLNQTLNGALSIVAPPLGALLMGLLPLHGVILVDVVTAALAIAPLCFVHVPQPRRADQDAEASSVWRDVRDGLRYVLNWPGLVTLIGAIMVFKIALTPAFSLMPLLVSDHFGGGAVQLSLLQSVIGVGVVLGGLILSAWGGFKRQIYTSMMGLCVIGVSFIILGLLPGHLFWAALATVFLMGLTVPIIDGPVMAIFQGTISPDMQGRVLTLVISLGSITSPIGLAVAGPVTDLLGIRIWYLAAGLLCGGMGVASFFAPAIVNIEQNNHSAPTVYPPASVPVADE